MITDWNPWRSISAEDFARLRIGIGRQNAARQITGHVLGKFSAAENALLEKFWNGRPGQFNAG